MPEPFNVYYIDAQEIAITLVLHQQWVWRVIRYTVESNICKQKLEMSVTKHIRSRGPGKLNSKVLVS